MRVFLGPKDILKRSATELRFKLDSEAAKHLTKVLRIAPGDSLTAVLPDVVITGEILAISRPEFSLRIQHVHPPVPDAPHITLIQCLPKQDKMGEILRASTEVGASAFVPALSQRCVSRPQDMGGKLERWRSIVKSAAAQSQRDALPHLHPLATLSELPDFVQNADLKLVCWEEESTQGWKTVLDHHTGPTQSVSLIIGPEGGLDAQEIEGLRQLGFQSVKLTMPILRVEHAAVVALAQLKLALELRNG